MSGVKDKITDQFMDLVGFIIEYGVIGTMVGTLIGFGINNFTTSIKNDLLKPYVIDKLNFGGTTGNAISSFIEFLAILIILFIFYKLLIKPLIVRYNQYKDEKQQDKAKNEQEWRKEVVNELKNLNDSLERRVIN